jgi:hypothetical protein
MYLLIITIQHFSPDKYFKNYLHHSCRIYNGTVFQEMPLRAWMFVSRVYVLLSCVGRDLCDGLIACPEESYRVSKNICY